MSQFIQIQRETGCNLSQLKISMNYDKATCSKLAGNLLNICWESAEFLELCQEEIENMK